jgi:hypothetical protein
MRKTFFNLIIRISVENVCHSFIDFEHNIHVTCMKYILYNRYKIKMTVFRNIAPCSLVDIDQCFRGAYCLIIALIMEAVSCFDMSVSFYQITQHNILEDSHLCTHHENLKSHQILNQLIKDKFTQMLMSEQFDLHVKSSGVVTVHVGLEKTKM